MSKYDDIIRIMYRLISKCISNIKTQKSIQMYKVYLLPGVFLLLIILLYAILYCTSISKGAHLLYNIVCNVTMYT